jgi:hypothetical protein
MLQSRMQSSKRTRSGRLLASKEGLATRYLLTRRYEYAKLHHPYSFEPNVLIVILQQNKLLPHRRTSWRQTTATSILTLTGHFYMLIYVKEPFGLPAALEDGFLLKTLPDRAHTLLLMCPNSLSNRFIMSQAHF